ncbi:peptidase M16 [Lentilactobacillus fungorum]|uniref:Peptidase M16 n=1 Tax=Lentilactobacillus fungorum TaxID=2201250 RepID=A0ABQ3VW08_9LACO|nr:insulinase family protein [Lentilactobacillus fungorum]GHP12608.1 peptidase M16 [Lentilactobacillus fungorum]
MEYRVANGVLLQVVPTDKFKNMKIMINLTSPIDHRNFAKLALLAELLENASAKYRSEMAVSRKLSAMYGASYGVSVLRYGNQHTLQIKMTYPNDQYLPDDHDLTAEVFAFLKEMIERPLVVAGQFEQAYFKIHQTNMINYLESIVDNKEYEGTLQLQKLYYPNDRDHGDFLLGSASEIRKITSEELLRYYRQVLAQAEVTVLVGGHVDSGKILAEVRRFKTFKDRPITSYPLLVVPDPVQQVAIKRQVITGSQSVLSLGYQLPIYFGSQDYFAAMIFNQLFGGSTRSLLFTNVREKASLAYDIHSNYSSLFGMVTVQAGIDGQNEKRVTQLIHEQLDHLAQGDFTDELLMGIKRSLINQHRSESDHLGALMDNEYLQHITKFSISDNDWENQVRLVNRSQLKAVATQLKLRAIVALNSGEVSHANH